MVPATRTLDRQTVHSPPLPRLAVPRKQLLQAVARCFDESWYLPRSQARHWALVLSLHVPDRSFFPLPHEEHVLKQPLPDGEPEAPGEP